MTFERAIEIVLELARENILTESDAIDNNLRGERQKQFDACRIVEEFTMLDFVEKTMALIQVLRMVEGTIKEQGDWTASIDDQSHTVAELVVHDVRRALAAHPLGKEVG